MKRIMFVVVIVGFSSVGESRTWRVNTSGTGDAPTLHAAMDSAIAGDVVLAEAGQYVLESSLFVPSGVHLMGESGPAQTLLYRDEYLAPSTVSLGFGAGMTGIHVRGNTLPVLFLHGSGARYCIVEAVIGQDVVQGGGG
ncbi:MAG: hypothetical protein L0Z51_01685 [Candidatus Latescibacteria bacterium]|nr:hypothetical protein [Candidatus Latescibacterota bacterium]